MKKKECSCLSCLNDDYRLIQAVAEHAFKWAHKKKEEADAEIVKMLRFPVVAEELMKQAKVKTDAGKFKKFLSGKKLKTNSSPLCSN